MELPEVKIFKLWSLLNLTMIDGDISVKKNLGAIIKLHKNRTIDKSFEVFKLV